MSQRLSFETTLRVRVFTLASSLLAVSALTVVADASISSIGISNFVQGDGSLFFANYYINGSARSQYTDNQTSVTLPPELWTSSSISTRTAADAAGSATATDTYLHYEGDVDVDAAAYSSGNIAETGHAHAYADSRIGFTIDTVSTIHIQMSDPTLTALGSFNYLYGGASYGAGLGHSGFIYSYPGQPADYTMQLDPGSYYFDLGATSNTWCADNDRYQERTAGLKASVTVISPAATPEPTTLAALTLGCLAVSRRGRKCTRADSHAG